MKFMHHLVCTADFDFGKANLQGNIWEVSGILYRSSILWCLQKCKLLLF